MSDKPLSPLRVRMVQDMTVRNFVPDTQREYIRAVKKLAAFLGRSPDTATAEDLRAFQLHLTQTGTNPPTINATVTALRFFFKVTLDRPETTRHLVFVFEPRKLPRVLPPEDVLRLLEAAPPPSAIVVHQNRRAAVSRPRNSGPTYSAATGLSSYTCASLPAARKSPDFNANSTRCNFIASSSDKYGPHAPSSGMSSTSTSAT